MGGGGAEHEAATRADVISLVDRFGADRALVDTAACITEVLAERLALL